MISEETENELREIIARYPQPRSALLPMLHLVQSVEGYVTPESIELCAKLLGLTAAEVAAVATFYTMYKRRPVGEHHVGVCTNTLCAVMGGDEILSCLKQHLGVGNDETTEDGKITLEHIECNAGCDYAPVVMVNWEFFDNMTPAKARQLVDDLRTGTETRATRGGTITSWRAAERVLAGFPDGRADEGSSAGPATLVGRELAEANGWTAPESSSGTISPGVGSRPSAANGRQAAAESDTKRAESESVAAESGAGAKTRQEPRGDETARGKADGGETTDGKGRA